VKMDKFDSLNEVVTAPVRFAGRMPFFNLQPVRLEGYKKVHLFSKMSENIHFLFFCYGILLSIRIMAIYIAAL